MPHFQVLLCHLHPVRLIYDSYPKKYKIDVLGGIIITWIKVTAVNRREYLCIFMKYEDFGDHELHCIQMWVRFISEGSKTHVFEYNEEK